MPRSDKRSRLSYEGHIMMLAVLAALPASACAMALLWSGGYQPRTEWTLTVVIVGGWLGFAAALRE
ncbi:MAG: PAS domain-containing sensor histidine kinase, partial [Bryobacteraceae bacterium]